jgi:hypothetical protein
LTAPAEGRPTLALQWQPADGQASTAPRALPHALDLHRFLLSARWRWSTWPMASAGAGAAVAELLRRLDHAWRVFGTGLSFAAFGVGGLLLGGLVMPALLLIRDERRRRRIARRWSSSRSPAICG